MGQLLVRTIGFRQAELALAMGTLFPPDRALSIGLVDAIESEQHGAESTIIEGLSELLPSISKDQASNPLMQKAFKQAHPRA